MVVMEGRQATIFYNDGTGISRKDGKIIEKTS